VNQFLKFIFFVYVFTSTVSANDFSSLEVLSDFSGNNDVFQTILSEYTHQYQKIGELESKRIIDQKNISIIGGLNSIGLSYQRPFAHFNFVLNRTLAPDLFDSTRWIVTDTCSIEVDASKLLSKLKSDKIIKISESNLLAYAGVVFKREYTWIHYSDSYESGLSTHFEKLFFPFTKLNKDQITSLENNEIIHREDKLSLSSGGLASVPIFQGVSAVAGAYLKYQLLSKLEIINYENNEESDHIHISQEKSKNIYLGMSAEVQLDLLKILRLTLFKTETSFEKIETAKIYLNIPKNKTNGIEVDNPVALEIDKVINNKQADINKLSKYIISEERRSSIKLEHKYNFLLLGGKKDAQTEQVEIVSAGKVKKYFKHNYEKIKFQEDLISKIFSGLIYALTQAEASAVKLISESKKVTIEYENEIDLVDSKGDLFIDNDNTHLSLSFVNNFTSKKLNKGERSVTNKLFYFIDHLTEIDSDAQNKIKSAEISTPFEYQSRFLVTADGVRYFNSLSSGEVLDNINSLCGQYPKNKFFNFRNLFDHCRNSISEDYFDYIKDFSHDKITVNAIEKCESKSLRYIFTPGKRRAFIKQCLMGLSLKEESGEYTLPMWSLKKIVTSLSNNIEDKVYFYNLFGYKNVFNTGYIESSLKNGNQFFNNFNGGVFKGYGVIENYKQTSIYRLPASVDLN
jgi:hypothetical protein